MFCVCVCCFTPHTWLIFLKQKAASSRNENAHTDTFCSVDTSRTSPNLLQLRPITIMKNMLKSLPAPTPRIPAFFRKLNAVEIDINMKIILT